MPPCETGTILEECSEGLEVYCPLEVVASLLIVERPYDGVSKVAASMLE